MTNLTAHSEFGFLQEVYLKPVAHAFIHQSVLHQQWKAHNFLNESTAMPLVESTLPFRVVADQPVSPDLFPEESVKK